MPPQALAGGAHPSIAFPVLEQASGRGAGGQAQVVAPQVAANGGGINRWRAVGGQAQGGGYGGAGVKGPAAVFFTDMPP